MRLMLHNFRKDVRRLWPAVLVACVMLAALARADRWRSDYIPGSLEGWLTVLVTMAWAALIALVVLEEPLVGDRNFWTTRPHRWPALLADKVLFAVLAIHVPLFVANVYVLAARGFSPAEDLGPLLGKQIWLFAAVTLPAMALASLVRSFTHAVLALFGLAAALLIFNGGFATFPEIVHQHTEVRNAVTILLLAGASVAVIWLQYARRRTVPARAIAAGVALLAASLSSWFPARAEYAIGKARALPVISLRSAPLTDDLIRRVGGDEPAMLLPVNIVQVGRAGHFHISHVQVEIDIPGGPALRSIQTAPGNPPGRRDVDSWLRFEGKEDGPPWLVLRFSRAAWNRVKDARVQIRGAAAFDFYRPGPTTRMATSGTADVPDLGRCTAVASDDNVYNSALKLLCESPRELRAASVTLRHDPSGREWNFRLNSWFSSSAVSGPRESWLSPLYRGQTYFPVAGMISSRPGDQWRVPAAYVAESAFEITPEIPTGADLATFTFRDVAPGEYSIHR